LSEPIPFIPPDHRDPLNACVHCGFCLDVCPTYQLTGDENNSPRGRLRLWKEEAQGRLAPDPWTTFYTQECVGCLACEPACPANVPYGEALEQVRHQHVSEGRDEPGWRLRVADWLAKRPGVFSAVTSPVRALRRFGLLPHRNLFAGQPKVLQSTAAYAEQMMRKHRPDGPRVALLTGCLMEAVFREINFATIRVLIENNIQVVIPKGQGCCGAFQEHAGFDGVGDLRDQNRQAFLDVACDAVLANSAGCGLALRKTLGDQRPVRDVIDFLEELGPLAKECCGSGGIYHLRKPENAEAILAKKAAFLNDAQGDPPCLVTTNHVCMMQWNSARAAGIVKRPFRVVHLIQLLDPQAVI
jgi:glycolate oxidase iron-sulfur subunit